jgi:hypothetical protein
LGALFRLIFLLCSSADGVVALAIGDRDFSHSSDFF